VVGAHDVQREVDGPGGPGRGQHLAVVDVQHLGVEPHLRVAAGELVRVHPVGGRRPPVEDAGGRERERAGAERHDPCPPVVGAADRGHGVAGRLHRARRDHERVGEVDRLDAVTGVDRPAAVDDQRPGHRGEVVRVSLCRSGGGYVYQVAVLGPGGQLRQVTIPAN
jgi:hypothetical protein